MRRRFPEAVIALTAWIVREGLPPGVCLPSARVLGLQFGFTTSTMLFACQMLVSSGVLQRKGYRLLVQSRPKDVAAIEGTVHVISNFSEFIQAARRALAGLGVAHRLTEYTYTAHPLWEPLLTRAVAEHPAGVILAVPTINEHTEAFLKGFNLPMVVCGDGVFSLTQSTVQADLYRGVIKGLRYLRELGHCEVAHLSPAGSEFSTRDLVAAYQAACLQTGHEKSASRIWEFPPGVGEEAFRAVLQKRLRQNPTVKAVFCSDYLGIMATRTFSVPGELSVMGFFDNPDGPNCRPPLTTVGIRDREVMMQVACSNLLSQIRAVQGGLPARPAMQALFVPDLIVRGSVKALLPVKRISGPSGHPATAKESDPAATWHKVYTFLKRGSRHNWRQVDLSKHANHSMTRQNGWLGAEPLRHFPPGLREIHGVPFQVVDEKRNQGKAVITLRSPQAHSSEDKELPESVEVSLNLTARALYFLHGCGFAKAVPFAEYIMHYEDGEPARVRLLPLDTVRPGERLRRGQPRANLQDWWPGHEQMHFPSAHHVLVFDPADPTGYQRSLYSLEWINPRPGTLLRSVEVYVDPKAGPTLALIAVTALL